MVTGNPTSHSGNVSQGFPGASAAPRVVKDTIPDTSQLHCLGAGQRDGADMKGTQQPGAVPFGTHTHEKPAGGKSPEAGAELHMAGETQDREGAAHEATQREGTSSVNAFPRWQAARTLGSSIRTRPSACKWGPGPPSFLREEQSVGHLPRGADTQTGGQAGRRACAWGERWPEPPSAPQRVLRDVLTDAV